MLSCKQIALRFFWWQLCTWRALIQINEESPGMVEFLTILKKFPDVLRTCSLQCLHYAIQVNPIWCPSNTHSLSDLDPNRLHTHRVHSQARNLITNSTQQKNATWWCILYTLKFWHVKQTQLIPQFPKSSDRTNIAVTCIVSDVINTIKWWQTMAQRELPKVTQPGTSACSLKEGKSMTVWLPFHFLILPWFSAKVS